MTLRLAAPLCTLLLALSAPGASSGLRWPLEQEPDRRALSSSFCEDRGARLHGGVDLSTGGRVGVPVVAAADGAIVRVKVAYRGLGRAVYVQHEGGLMTVYGHLAGFAEPVRGWVDELLARKGPYPGDFFPDEPIPVRAGRTIAWSGDTGGGPPHLHFETRRDGGNRPVDPWAEGLPCLDRAPPRLHALAVMPREAPWRERVLELPLAAPLQLDGSELLRLRASDPFGAGTGFVRRLELRLDDGTELYRWDAGSFTYPVSRYAGHAFSLAAPTGAEPSAPGSWAWLLVWPGGGLPFVTGRSALDAWDWGPPGARRELVLTATDGCGNVAVERIPVTVAARAAEAGPALETLPSAAPPELQSRRHPPAARRSCAPGLAFRLEAGPAALAWPAHAAAAPVEVVLSPAPSTAVLPPPPGLRTVAGPTDARPAWLPLAKKATVSFRVPTSAVSPRLGIHRWNPATRRWQFWGDDVATAGRLGTTTDRLGTFALLEDAAPPRVVAVTRRAVAGLPWRDDADELVVRYEEVGEGIAWDGLRFRPADGGTDWIARHDPDEAEGAFVLPPERRGKRLRGTLVLEDLAGNVTERAVDSAP